MPRVPQHNATAGQTRFAIVARLRPGAEPKAAALVAAGPPFDPASVGLARHAVFVSYGEVVFVFEGEAAEQIVSDLVDGPLRLAALDAWGELVDGQPRIARQGWFWEAGEP
jgi:hypothetical protein